jgi:hypothetical protein
MFVYPLRCFSSSSLDAKKARILARGLNSLLFQRFTRTRGSRVCTCSGPFTSIANLSHTHGNDEDSYLWQQPDGSLHILYHNGANGLHAFSDDKGIEFVLGFSVFDSAHSFSIECDFSSAFFRFVCLFVCLGVSSVLASSRSMALPWL